MPETLSQCLTPRELAARWRVRTATVRQLIRRGALAAIQIGRGVKILPESIRDAESGPLAVRPRKRRMRVEKLDAEIEAILSA